MRKLLVIAIAAFALVALVATAMAATKSIKVGDDYYVRASGVPTVTVSKGTTVKWSFRGSNSHSVTVSKGPRKFNSGVRSGGSYKKKVTRRGSYTIYCTVHDASNQKMKLVVK
jgi:plastocyanin